MLLVKVETNKKEKVSMRFVLPWGLVPNEGPGTRLGLQSWIFPVTAVGEGGDAKAPAWL